MSETQTTSVRQLAQRDRQSGIVDVRTPLEYSEVRAIPARNIPVDALDPHPVMKNRNGVPDKPLYSSCKNGTRGAKACQKFVDAGYASIITRESGTEAWVAAGLPVVRAKKVMSREQHFPGALNVPLEILRERISERPRDRRIVAYCQVGPCGYMATRPLQQASIDAANLSGGYRLIQRPCQLETN